MNFGHSLTALAKTCPLPASQGSTLGVPTFSSVPAYAIRLFLDEAIQAARLNGCRRMTLLTDRANESAQRFYQRHGFGSSAMILLRLLLG
ncbi:MAG: GNAT family N-acetyltransferase [Rugosibacter sp.]|nr:GNAT family N-acetyltransferase [Rugosibacter sp.]